MLAQTSTPWSWGKREVLTAAAPAQAGASTPSHPRQAGSGDSHRTQQLEL